MRKRESPVFKGGLKRERMGKEDKHEPLKESGKRKEAEIHEDSKMY